VKPRTIPFLGLLLCLAAPPAPAAPHFGKISGVVVDPGGTPQMGASVVITAESLLFSSPIELLTNDRGHFLSQGLMPGSYSVRVTLAGFLPVMEQHIRVTDQQTTLLQIALGSMFSSLEGLRRQPNQQAAASDEWTWVLRTTSAIRPVLRWQDGEAVLDDQLTSAERARRQQPRGRVELTSGSHHPGSISNQADSPGTAIAYDQALGTGRLLFAGQVSYESASPSGGFATEWLPSGDSSTGSVTNVVVRESRLGPQGPTFRGLRLDHESQFAVGDRISIRYGAEYVLAGFEGTAAALHPRGEIVVQIAPDWQASAIVATRPWHDSATSAGALGSALDSLDAFPTLLIRNGRPVLDSDMHEEVALQHAVGRNASIETAAFHDRSTHTAVFGRGNVSNGDFLQDFFSDAFAYDAGVSSSWGTRLAYRQKFWENFDTTLAYAYAGALAPDAYVATGDLRAALRTRYRHSLAARISGRTPRLGTQFTAAYKWINGAIISRQDAYGEAFLHLDPNLNFTVRQPLPSFIPGHMEALADFGNLLSQGYIPIETHDGRVLLVPAYRSFRGGFSFQF
jgi:hypothetical protein